MAVGKLISIALNKKQMKFLSPRAEILGIPIPAMVKRLINNAIIEEIKENEKKGIDYASTN